MASVNSIRTPTREEIFMKRTKNGGWTAATLANWGIQWPPVRGWINRLIAGTLLPHEKISPVKQKTLLDFGWTQDYQEFEFQEQICEREYNMFIRRTRAKTEISLADRVNQLPYDIRLIILNYLKELLTYGQPKLPALLQVEFFNWHRNERFEWFKTPYAHMTTYDLNRGYCSNCGEPAQQLRCLDHSKRYDKRWRYKLPLNTLTLMGICYFCLCMGYNYDYHTDSVAFPRYMRFRDRSKHYPNIY
jgi:hypothetical protein